MVEQSLRRVLSSIGRDGAGVSRREACRVMSSRVIVKGSSICPTACAVCRPSPASAGSLNPSISLPFLIVESSRNINQLKRCHTDHNSCIHQANQKVQKKPYELTPASINTQRSLAQRNIIAPLKPSVAHNIPPIPPLQLDSLPPEPLASLPAAPRHYQRPLLPRNLPSPPSRRLLHSTPRQNQTRSMKNPKKRAKKGNSAKEADRHRPASGARRRPCWWFCDSSSCCSRCDWVRSGGLSGWFRRSRRSRLGRFSSSSVGVASFLLFFSPFISVFRVEERRLD